MVAACMGSDTKLYFPAVQQIRQLLSVGTCQFRKFCYNTRTGTTYQRSCEQWCCATSCPVPWRGLYRNYFLLTRKNEMPKLQFEAAWALTNGNCLTFLN